jgi:hypothetical protein
LRLTGEGETAPELTRAAYAAAGRPDALSTSDAPDPATAALDWLTAK